MQDAIETQSSWIQKLEKLDNNVKFKWFSVGLSGGTVLGWGYNRVGRDRIQKLLISGKINVEPSCLSNGAFIMCRLCPTPGKP